MKELKVGVIGLGAIGQKHCESLAQIRGAKLAAVADINESLLSSTAEKFGAKAYIDFDQLISNPDLDAVVIATPDHLHRDVSILAADAGKHILVEKPIATSEEDALAMISAAEKAGVKLMVGFTLRFIPHYKQARQAVENGNLGQLVSIFARRLNVITQADRIGGRCGVLHFLGIHDFDMMRWMVGSEPVSIYSEASTSVPRVYPQENETFNIIRFSNGVIGCAQIGWNLPKSHPGGRDFKLDLIGNQGSLNMDLAKQGIELYSESGIKFPSTAPGLIEEDRAFIDCILDDKPVPVTGQDGLIALKMVLAALESIETKQPVNIHV
jgi:predicted dehydrogenase